MSHGMSICELEGPLFFSLVCHWYTCNDVKLLSAAVEEKAEMTAQSAIAISASTAMDGISYFGDCLARSV